MMQLNPRCHGRISDGGDGWFYLPDWVYVIGLILSGAASIASFVFMFAMLTSCGPTYHDQSMAEIREMHCPELERLIEEAEKAGIDLTANEKDMKDFCRE